MANGTTSGRQPVPTKQDLAKRAADPLSTIRALLEQAKPRLAEVVPKHLTAERLVRFAVSAAAKTPKLLKCTPESMLAATLQAAGLGLEPNTPLQQCYLVPYDSRKQIQGQWQTVSEVQFQIGYRGYILLALQAGIVTSVKAMLVYAKDVFRYRDGLNPVLDHEPTEDADPGPLRGAYCRWTLANGERDFVYWSIAKLLKHMEQYAPRDRNKKIVGPWADKETFPAMCLKTTVRDASRFWPMSPEKSDKLREALEADDAATAPLTNGGSGIPGDPWGLRIVADGEAGAPPDAEAVEALLDDELAWLDRSQADLIRNPASWFAAIRMAKWGDGRMDLVLAEAQRRVDAVAEDARLAAEIDAGRGQGSNG